MDTPIGQFLLIGNFRRRLARELLVLTTRISSMRFRDTHGYRVNHLNYLVEDTDVFSIVLRGLKDGLAFGQEPLRLTHAHNVSTIHSLNHYVQQFNNTSIFWPGARTAPTHADAKMVGFELIPLEQPRLIAF